MRIIHANFCLNWQRILIHLLVAGFPFVSGCVKVATGNFYIKGIEIKEIVGDESDSLIQTDITQRDRVRKLLGKPFFESKDGRVQVYEAAQSHRWHLNILPVALAGSLEGSKLLRVDYDDRGVVNGYAIKMKSDRVDRDEAVRSRWPDLTEAE